jgi:hypothetical protein
MAGKFVRFMPKAAYRWVLVEITLLPLIATHSSSGNGYRVSSSTARTGINPVPTLFISHSLIVLSEEPEAIIPASLDMATEET